MFKLDSTAEIVASIVRIWYSIRGGVYTYRNLDPDGDRYPCDTDAKWYRQLHCSELGEAALYISLTFFCLGFLVEFSRLVFGLYNMGSEYSYDSTSGLPNYVIHGTMTLDEDILYDHDVYMGHLSYVI